MIVVDDKPDHDPVSDMVIVDAYLRWALEAVKGVIGQNGLEFILREGGLEHLITRPPSGEMIVSDFTFGDYAQLNAALLNHYQQPGKHMVQRIARESTQMAFSFQRNLFNMTTMTAAQVLPSSLQIKMGLSAMMAGFKTFSRRKAKEEYRGTIEDRGDHFLYIVETCHLCAGKQSESCICWMYETLIEEGARQSFGKFFDVVEIECRAKGAPACVFRVPKQPSEEGSNQSAR